MNDATNLTDVVLSVQKKSDMPTATCYTILYDKWNDRGKVDASAKVWRYTGEKWSRQSEEMPLHRVIDLAIFVCRTKQYFRDEAYKSEKLYDEADPLYFNDDEQRHTPHFYVKYGEYEASFDFDGNLLADGFPKKQTKYVVAWADIHRDELSALWDVMQTDEQYFKIKGLE